MMSVKECFGGNFFKMPFKIPYKKSYVLMMPFVMVMSFFLMPTVAFAYDSKTSFIHRYERIAGDIVGIPMPDWKNTGANVTYTMNKGFTRFQISPAHTDVEFSKQRQVITLMDVKKDVTPLSYLDYLIKQEIATCGERDTMAQVWQQQDRYMLALLICGKNTKGQSHNRLLNIYQVQNKLVTIAHHWMAKPYHPNLTSQDTKRSQQKMPISNTDVQWFQSGAGLKYCVNVDKNKACKNLIMAYEKDVQKKHNMMRYVLSKSR